MKEKMMLIVPMLHQGGFERVCVMTARLLEAYYDIYIVLFDSRDIAYDIKGLNVIDLHLGSRESFLEKLINVFKRSHCVRRLKRKLDVDIAYSFGPTANVVNVLSRTREQVWIGIRSYMDMANHAKIKLFCRKADKVLCCTKLIEEEIRTSYRCGKAVTLYNPIDIREIRRKAAQEECRLPWEDRERIVVSMGREDDVKGFWHLLKSFSLVRGSLPGAKLLIIGDGEFEEYKQLAKELGVSEFVHFTGLKKNPFPYLAVGSLYVLTSSNEGFPNALVEAMALGIPAVATDCMTGPREILLEKYDTVDWGQNGPAVYGEYGVLIPPMDPEKNLDPQILTEEEGRLAEQMALLLRDEEMHRKYREAALYRVNKFSNEQYVRDIMAAEAGER